MISSDVSLISALGPAPGANTVQDAGNPAARTAGFAALMDEAAMAGGKAASLKGAVSAGVAAPADAGASEMIFIADWCLSAPEIMVAFQQLRSDATSSEEEVAVEVEGENADGDDEQSQLEGVLNIEWLFARPVRMWAGDQPKHSEGSGGSGDSRSGGSGTGDSRSAGSSNEIPIDAMRMLDAPIAAVAPQASQGQANLEAAPESMEKALTDALKQQPERALAAETPAKAAQAAATPKSAVTKSIEPPVDTTAARAAMTPDMVVADTSRAAASEAPVESASKPSAAATRFAKAIERLHGSTPDAVVAERAQAFSGQSSSGQENTPGFGSAHRDVAPLAPVRGAHVETATFTVPMLGDIQRTLDIAARMVEVQTSAGETLPEADTLRQLVQTMRMQFKDGIGDAVVRLRPEHLGEVSISLRVDQQSVTATVHAEVAAVRQWLETQEASLRNGLAEQGLNLEKLVVLEDGQQQSQQDEQAERQGRRQQRRNRNGEPEPKFEITV
jgi:flagellar hook-length control protein FliK